MATIIGRKQEQKELRRLFSSDEAEMVVVYGRRRVGKTFLVNQVFAQEEFAFKVTGLYKKRMNIQLENFASAMNEYSNSEVSPTPKTWMEAFDPKQGKNGCFSSMNCLGWIPKGANF